MNALIPSVSKFLSDPTDLLFRNLLDSDSLFDSFFNIKKIDYPVDVKETKDGLTIDVAAINLDRKDINIDIKDGNILCITHKKESKEDNDDYLYRGITKKSFEFAWKISSKFDIDKATANLDKGLLKIQIPISEQASVNKKIEIK